MCSMFNYTVYRTHSDTPHLPGTRAHNEERKITWLISTRTRWKRSTRRSSRPGHGIRCGASVTRRRCGPRSTIGRRTSTRASAGWTGGSRPKTLDASSRASTRESYFDGTLTQTVAQPLSCGPATNAQVRCYRGDQGFLASRRSRVGMDASQREKVATAITRD